MTLPVDGVAIAIKLTVQPGLFALGDMSAMRSFVAVQLPFHACIAALIPASLAGSDLSLPDALIDTLLLPVDPALDFIDAGVSWVFLGCRRSVQCKRQQDCCWQSKQVLFSFHSYPSERKTLSNFETSG